MRPFAALYGLRVGCVQYLNAKPLIAPYDGEVVFGHPACLADRLAAGEIDIGLVPAFEALRRPDFPIVDGIAIASQGAVYSVILAHGCPVREIGSVGIDTASRTSNNLTRCLLAEYYGITPVFEQCDGAVEGNRARVLIGNQAICFREGIPAGVSCMDLGAEWLVRTGLPFVYAVWQMRPEIANAPAVAAALRAVKEAGTRRVREIARLQGDFPAMFAERYLTEYIKFEMGAEQKRGLERFQSLLTKYGLIEPAATALSFV